MYKRHSSRSNKRLSTKQRTSDRNRVLFCSVFLFKDTMGVAFLGNKKQTMKEKIKTTPVSRLAHGLPRDAVLATGSAFRRLVRGTGKVGHRPCSLATPLSSQRPIVAALVQNYDHSSRCSRRHRFIHIFRRATRGRASKNCKVR